MRCPKCGYENKEDDLYCNLCQEVLKKKNINDAIKTPAAFNEPQKSGSNSGYIILVITAVLIAGTCFYFRNKADSKTSDYLSRNNNEFTQNINQSEHPVLVDFFAPWCHPCQMMAPIMEELKTEYADKIVIIKINTDENQDLATMYNISGIPTFMFFKNGKVVDKVIGSVPKEMIKDKIEQILSK